LTLIEKSNYSRHPFLNGKRSISENQREFLVQWGTGSFDFAHQEPDQAIETDIPL
jgi:hypothetical protein